MTDPQHHAMNFERLEAFELDILFDEYWSERWRRGRLSLI